MWPVALYTIHNFTLGLVVNEFDIALGEKSAIINWSSKAKMPAALKNIFKFKDSYSYFVVTFQF